MTDVAEMRTPPHSVEAEQSVLGGLMLDSSAWDQVADVVQAADFYRPDHRLIFDAIGALARDGNPVDVVTVSEQLERHGKLGDAGGLAYVSTLARDTPTAANIRSYADIVRERSLLRALIQAGGEIVTSVFQSGGAPARELVDEAERRVFEIAERGARSRDGAIPARALLPGLIDKIDEWYHNPNMLRGLPSGFTELDRKTGGFRAGDLVIVAGRPSMGKTTLAVNMAEFAALSDTRAVVAIFSMEMPAEQLLLRMMASVGHVPLVKVRSGKMDGSDWDRITGAARQLGDARIYIDETPALTPTELRARARRVKRENKDLSLVVIDYLQLMQVPGNQENRATEIAEISRGLKALAKELQIPVIALSQLNRGVEQRENKKPVMSDLRECVTGDTLVCLASGERKPIRELVGQTPEVWALDGSQKVVAARSDCVWKVGKRPIFEVRLASGRSLRATAEHRIYGGEGWTTVSKLAPGERLALARELPEPEETTRWPDHHVVLLGHLVGDGSYLNHQPLRYTTASEENSVAVSGAAELFGCRATRHAGRGEWHQLVISGNGSRWHARGVGAWLKELGIFGQRSHEKHLPASVFRLPNDQVALLLRHLWATDGSVTVRPEGERGSSRIYFASCSERLARDVLALLLRLGIVGRVRRVVAGTARPWFTVDVSGGESQKLFCARVGGFGPRADPVRRLARRLASRRTYTRLDTLPASAFEQVQAEMEVRGISTREMARLRGTVHAGSSQFAYSPSRETLRSYAELLGSKELAEWSESQIFWDRVVEVVGVGEEDVFDLTVRGYENWLADGVVSHNSGAIEQDADMILLIYREEVYDKNTPKRGMAEINLVKHRNGEIGEFVLTFQGEYTRFVNYVDPSYAEGILR
jgi:replicative DNA helicase